MERKCFYQVNFTTHSTESVSKTESFHVETLEDVLEKVGEFGTNLRIYELSITRKWFSK